ncbi:MAG: hypothetical protein AAF409_08710 [Pseudomonadota bacterium]
MQQAYSVVTAGRYKLLLAFELVLGAGAVAWFVLTDADVSAWCGEDSAVCDRMQYAVYFGLLVVLLVAVPLGLSGMIGQIRRDGMELVATEYELKFGRGGRWEGPLAWHRIKTFGLDRGLLGPRIGIDLRDPERVIDDFGRPLGPIEDWRMKRGGPTITISGFALGAPIEEVYAKLEVLRSNAR